MKIGFFLEWMVGSLDPSNKWNVVGEELLSLGWCKELEKLDSSISADVYSYNKLPKEKLDVMIYMNYITKPNYDWADVNIMYIENDFGHNGSEHIVYNTFLKKYKFNAILSFSERIIPLCLYPPRLFCRYSLTSQKFVLFQIHLPLCNQLCISAKISANNPVNLL